MKRSEPQSVGEIVREVLRNEHLDSDFDQQRAVTLWPVIVGSTINRYTTMRYIRNGVLTVHLSSASLKSELSMHKAGLMRSLNDAIGAQAVNDIIFK